MVHARVPEVYVHFSLMYDTDHIFPVLTIKDLINEDGDQTTPHKIATGTKPSVSHFTCFIFSVCCTESYRARWDKDVKHASPSAKRVSRHLFGCSAASKSSRERCCVDRICSFLINVYDRSHISGYTNQRPYKRNLQQVWNLQCHIYVFYFVHVMYGKLRRTLRQRR